MKKEFGGIIKKLTGNSGYFRPNPTTIYAYAAYSAQTLSGEEKIELMNCRIDKLEMLFSLADNCPVSEIRVLLIYEDGKNAAYTVNREALEELRG